MSDYAPLIRPTPSVILVCVQSFVDSFRLHEGRAIILRKHASSVILSEAPVLSLSKERICFSWRSVFE